MGNVQIHRAVAANKVSEVAGMLRGVPPGDVRKIVNEVSPAVGNPWDLLYKATPLVLAVQTANYDMVKFLLDLGADPNNDVPGKDSSLSFAIFNLSSAEDRVGKYRDYDIITALIDKGANVNMESSTGEANILETAFIAGYGASTHPKNSAELGKVINLLLQKGADRNALLEKLIKRVKDRGSHLSHGDEVRKTISKLSALADKYAASIAPPTPARIAPPTPARITPPTPARITPPTPARITPVPSRTPTRSDASSVAVRGPSSTSAYINSNENENNVRRVNLFKTMGAAATRGLTSVRGPMTRISNVNSNEEHDRNTRPNLFAALPRAKTASPAVRGPMTRIANVNSNEEHDRNTRPNLFAALPRAKTANARPRTQTVNAPPVAKTASPAVRESAVNKSDKSGTWRLYTAARDGDYDSVVSLLIAKANPNKSRGVMGRAGYQINETPLYIAAISSKGARDAEIGPDASHAKIVKELLEHGANPKHIVSLEETILDMAKSGHHFSPTVNKIIRSHGVRHVTFRGGRRHRRNKTHRKAHSR